MRPLLWIFTVCLLSPLATTAQDSQRSRYEAYMSDRQKAFKDYIDSRNAEYVRYMKQRWSEAAEQPAVQAPQQPKPPIPATPPADAVQKENRIAVGSILPKPTLLPAPTATPAPAAPIPVKSDGQQLKFGFLGAACTVTDISSPKPTMPDASENSVAALWEKFSAASYRNILADCLRIRNDLMLCDWAYLKMLETLTAQWYPDRRNEATLLQIFLLTQSGYKVRIARTGDRIVMLMPSSDMLYGYRYIQLGREKYFVIGNQKAADGYYVFDRAFPGEQQLSMRTANAPELPFRSSPTRKLTSRRYPEMSVDVAVNLNLMEFYKLYPGCDVGVYAEIPPCPDVKEHLYPQLRRMIEGKSITDAAGMLLDFVQTAFEYKTDQEQFGCERPLFAEETLYYPFCDCEDRAVLYARFVRDLLGAEVVLLQYPEHVATAVHFTGDVTGDYLNIDGKRFTVCDPTYIGAGIGRTMPGMNNKTVKVILW